MSTWFVTRHSGAVEWARRRQDFLQVMATRIPGSARVFDLGKATHLNWLVRWPALLPLSPQSPRRPFQMLQKHPRHWGEAFAFGVERPPVGNHREAFHIEDFE